MTHKNKFDNVTGMSVYDSSGEKIGAIKDLYLDESSEEPKWATVSSGIFGTKRHFIPLEGARMHENGLVTPFDKDTILKAPQVKADEDLGEADENRLYSHYSMDEGAEQRTGQEQVKQQKNQAGRMKLRKYIVTETQQVEVPTQREIYKLEDEQAGSDDMSQKTGVAERDSVRKPVFGEVRNPSSEE